MEKLQDHNPQALLCEVKTPKNELAWEAFAGWDLADVTMNGTWDG